MKHFILLLALLGCQASHPETVIVRAGRLIDGSGAPAQKNQRVTITRGEITQVVPDDDSPVPQDAQVIDARAHTVLPGLVNAHVHIVNAGACEDGVGVGVRAAVRNLRGLVRGGVTTAADLAAPAFVTLGLRAFSGVGEDDGPRLVVAGPMLVPPKGYMTNILDGELVKVEMLREIGTPDEARRAVQELAEAGVDLIKLGLQDFHYDLTPLPLMPREVVCAAVEEAHTQDLRIVAHAVTPAVYEMALDCGVDAFVHGMLDVAPESLVRRLAETRTPVAPTLFVFLAPLWGPKHPTYYDSPAVRGAFDDATRATFARYSEAFHKGGEFLPSEVIPNIPRDATTRATDANLANTRALHEHGAALAMGTDGGNCMNPLGSPIAELWQLQAAGLTPLEILRAATHTSAQLLGLGDALGLVRPGYRGDLVVVRGQPDERLDDIVNVERVLIDGREQDLSEPGLWDVVQAATRIVWTKVRG